MLLNCIVVVLSGICRELAPGTVSLTGDRAHGDESKHCAYSTKLLCLKIILSNVIKSNEF